MDFWQKQDPSKPLFENLLWSKPETKSTAGKLLIIGGQKENFSKIAKAYEQAVKSGAGTVKILLPDSLYKIAHFLPDVEFAPSNKSGGFGAGALDTMLSLSAWADMVLLAGDLGKNSETAVLLDKYIEKYTGRLTISGSAFESIHASFINRPDTLVVTELSGLQKLSKEIKFEKAFTHSLGAVDFAQVLQEFSQHVKSLLVCEFGERVWVAVDSKVSSTSIKSLDQHQISATTSVWWMQNPTKSFEALTTSLVENS